MGGRCWLQIQHQQKQTLATEKTGTYQVTVLPDQWRVNGNFAQATGKYQNQKVLVQLFLTSQQQQRELMAVTQPVCLQIHGKISPLLPATNQNQFDYRFYKQQLGIYNQIKGQGSLRLLPGQTLLDQLHCLRARISHRFTNFPQPLASYCQRLLLGQSDPELATTIGAARELGVIHLFCLSGLHAFVFVGLLEFVLRQLHLTQETITLVAILALPFLWILGGGAVSLTRAILMLELQLIAKALGKNQQVAWNASLIIHSLIMPGVLLSLGGQLSYLLALAIGRCRITHPGLRAIAIQLVGLPALLVSAYQFHFLTVLLNWLLIPLFGSFILPAVIVTAGFGQSLPILISITNQLLLIFQNTLIQIATWPGNVYFGKISPLIAVGLTVMALVLIEKESHFRRYWSLLGSVYLICFCFIHFPLSGEVTFVDIGQGDCAIIRTPFNRQVIMIDTGGQLTFRQPAWAKRINMNDRATSTSINYLKSKGIHRIDYLCLSHSDADHIGFTSTVMKNLQVKTILVPAGMEKMPKFTKRLPKKVAVVPVTDQQHLEGFPLLILHPFKTGQGKNEDSMVLWGELGGKKFIFSGDLDRAGERAVIKKYPPVQADIVKLGHHGSKTASDPQYLSHLHPQLAIISAGRQNRYGHPNQETIQTLKRIGCPFMSTQNRGMITYQYWGKRGSIITKLKGSELKWMLPLYARN
ncbi:DNA internalization-related competence protein ComEC/Rec2 [Lactobacillus sp. 3B(2020)]|nr:DNA internalization-related competence protein ComEC/Rec2 [Lactobacillus sp. 3B(2020)]QLL70303.1 DNA internalization-related competence protein ComEC/Rec2 [Lactobacillus sp. 3B(2020)]